MARPMRFWGHLGGGVIGHRRADDLLPQRECAPLHAGGRARSDSAATLAAFVQLQPKGSGMTKAIESAPRQPIGTAALTGGAWTDFRLDVDLAPGDEDLPLRPLLQVDGKPVQIDAIAFVAWDEPENGEPPAPGRSYRR